MFDQVGEWTTASGLNISNHNAFHEFGTTNISLRVTTIEATPYVMRKPGTNASDGNDQYEGFCIDLLKTVASMLGFNYELYLVPDGKYGAENMTTGEWNGLVREIIDKVSVEMLIVMLMRVKMKIDCVRKENELMNA